MSASARTNWFWSDWLGDQAVRRLTPAERGVWIDLLALMAAAAPTGYLCDEKGRQLSNAELGRVCNCSEKEIADYITGITDKGVASRDRTGRLFNRRMVREAEVSARRRLNGKAGGAATRLKWQALSAVPQQTPGVLPRQYVSTLSNISKKEGLQGSKNLAESVRARGWVK